MSEGNRRVRDLDNEGPQGLCGSEPEQTRVTQSNDGVPRETSSRITSLEDAFVQLQACLQTLTIQREMRGKCFACKQSGHTKIDCPMKDKCWHCLGDGHFKMNCPNRKSGLNSQGSRTWANPRPAAE